MSKAIQVLVIPAVGPCRITTLTPDDEGSVLGGMQAIVGGNVQALSIQSHGESPRQIKELAVLWCDEEGKLTNKPFNARATVLVTEHLPIGLERGDYISGDAFLTGPTDDEGETTSVGDAILALIAECCRQHGRQTTR